MIGLTLTQLVTVLILAVLSMVTVVMFVMGVRDIKRVGWNSWRALLGWSVILSTLVVARWGLFDFVHAGLRHVETYAGLAIGFLVAGVLLARNRRPQATMTPKGVLILFLIFACGVGYLFWEQMNQPYPIPIPKVSLILLALIAVQFIFLFIESTQSRVKR